MTDQLSLYNGALRLCGDAKLANLSEAREPRYVLDDVWGDGARDDCLEMGLWNFAMRTAEIDYAVSPAPTFGHRRAFAKPVDWIRTAAIASDEYFRSPLTGLDYRDEVEHWYADLDTIYVRYVSNDASYGLDFDLWPVSFVRLVEGYLAREIAPRISAASGRIEIIEKEFQRRLLNARSKDAQNEGAAFAPPTGWQTARAGRWGRRRERGSP